MEARKYSKEIAKIIKDYLEKDEWHYDFDEECGVFSFGCTIDGKAKSVDLSVCVHADAFTVRTTSDAVTADEENPEELAKLAEFIVRANYKTPFGTFDMDYEDGEISFWMFVDCDECLPSEAILRNAIVHSIVDFEQFAPGFLKILYGDTDAKTAFELCTREDDEESDDKPE